MDHPHHLHVDGTHMTFADIDLLGAAMIRALEAGKQFVVRLAEVTADLVAELNRILARANLQITIRTGHVPDGLDYVVHAIAGGLAGAAGGGLLGAGAAIAARQLAARGLLLAVPGIGPFVVAGTVAGALMGVSGALMATHYGLRLEITAADTIDLTFDPA